MFAGSKLTLSRVQPRNEPTQPGVEQPSGQSLPGVRVLDPHRLDQADTGDRSGQNSAEAVEW